MQPAYVDAHASVPLFFRVAEVTTILSNEQLLGLEDTHVVSLDASCCLGECRLQPAVARALERLRADACSEGFDLRVVSGFRSFERQARIWNEKATGSRPVLDDAENPIDVHAIDETALVLSILRWSALPGASRHHWGTDLDVIDAARLAPGQAPRLTVADANEGGPFAALHAWLDERIGSGRAHGFFRPYTGAGCRVAPEPWHLSFAPLARECQRGFEPALHLAVLRDAGLALYGTIARIHAQIMRDYVAIPETLYACALGGAVVGREPARG